MQKMVFRVLVTLSLASALLFSCDQTTNSDGSGSGDGDGDGQSISFVAGGQQYIFTENLAAAYTPGDDETCVVGYDYLGDLPENAVHIYFPGKAAGTFTGPPEPDSVTGLPRLGILIDYAYYGWEENEGCSFTIEVTAYGPVGARIEGTFFGELADEGGNKIEVTEGTFSVMRYD